jgi:hypothetical protein
VGAIGLRAGRHVLHIEGLHTESGDVPVLLWQAPGGAMSRVPESAFSHTQ